MTWVEKGVLKKLATSPGPSGAEAPATVNMSMVQEGTDLSIDRHDQADARGLLVTFFWYIRGVPPTTSRCSTPA